uniref:Trithorax group protein osa-like n=1 Tax=Phallusia mammillata TaxID=59560 RepID=A0A6F9DX74_9ASCI|nr:trithorax group protein osa-like [Phallusia mammillata]
MLSSLDVLTKAANYVENQERNGFEPRRNGTQPSTATRAIPKPSRENGDTGHNAVTCQSNVVLDETKHSKEVRSAMNHHKSSDEPGNPPGTVSVKPESMRLNDRSPGEDTSMANYNHSNGVLHQRLYQDDRHLLSSYRNCSTESPTRSLSPVAKRPQSPSNVTDSEHGPRPMVLPHPLTSMAGVSGHPMAHFAPHNPMLPFLNPFMYPAAAFDPNVCAETLARQQGLALSGEVERQQQQSPGSSPNAASSSAGITPAALQGFMYPLAANPAYLMGARVSQTPGMGLADIPMLFPSQIAAYGASMMPPGQVPALGALSEADKRVYESLPGFAHHTQAHLLANPYFKSFCAPTAAATSMDAISATKDAAAAAAAAAAAGAAIPGMPGYSLEVLLKYQDLANEAMKMKGILSPQQSSPSPAPRRSSSPESSKKSHPVAPYPFSVPFPPAYLTNPSGALSKSPAPERKVSTPTMGPLKNGTGVPQPHHQHQQDVAARAARERDLMYAGNNHDLGMHVNGDEARRKLMALAQRPRNPSDLYSSPYKGPHDRTDRRSPSPYNSDRRRISRERSPGRSLSADKSAKKRSHDSSYPEPKSRSPGLQHQIDGNRVTKSPHRRSSSPMSRMPPRHSQGANPYLAVPGNKAAQDKETPSYLTQTPPYAFPQTLGGFPGAPYALQSYLRQADPNAPTGVKSSIAGFTAPAFSAGQTSQLYRSPAPADAAALAEYSRLAGIPPYAAIALLMPQQQQALRQSVIAHATQNTQNLLEKERSSPVVNPMLQAHHRAQAQNAAKLAARDSPVPQQHVASTASSNATSKAPKMVPGLPYAYGAYAKSRTPPGYQEVPVKREAASPQARRASHLPTFSGKVGGNTVRSSDEERANRLKRKVQEDEEERNAAGKDAGVKQRKREINADPNAAANIDEHFRRSLGGNYKKEVEPPAHQQIVNITSSVDDHFQKALGGDVWSRLKPNNKPSSPEAPEATERREAPAPFRGDISMPPAQHVGIPPSMYLPVQADSRHLLYAQSGKLPPNGNKTVKASRIVYPEAPQAEPASRTYSSNSSSSIRSDRSSPPPSKVELGYTNKFVPENKARIPGYQAPSAPALNCRSTQSPVKELHYPEHDAQRHPGTSPGSKQPPPYTIASSSYGGSPTATVPPPYSPQSAAAKSSPPPRQGSNDGQHEIQDQIRAKSRYLSGLET